MRSPLESDPPPPTQHFGRSLTGGLTVPRIQSLAELIQSKEEGKVLLLTLILIKVPVLDKVRQHCLEAYGEIYVKQINVLNYHSIVKTNSNRH